MTSEFDTALGQYINYRFILKNKDPNRLLYLAVSQEIDNSFFRLVFTQEIIKEYEVNLVVYNPDKEEIIRWIN